jgi:hypothetical protein
MRVDRAARLLRVVGDPRCVRGPALRLIERSVVVEAEKPDTILAGAAGVLQVQLVRRTAVAAPAGEVRRGADVRKRDRGDELALAAHQVVGVEPQDALRPVEFKVRNAVPPEHHKPEDDQQREQRRQEYAAENHQTELSARVLGRLECVDAFAVIGREPAGRRQHRLLLRRV